MTLYTSKVVAQWLCLTERRVQTSEDKVLCMFPRCVRKEYERYWPQGKQSDEKAKDH